MTPRTKRAALTALAVVGMVATYFGGRELAHKKGVEAARSELGRFDQIAAAQADNRLYKDYSSLFTDKERDAFERSGQAALLGLPVSKDDMLRIQVAQIKVKEADPRWTDKYFSPGNQASKFCEQANKVMRMKIKDEFVSTRN